MPRVAYRSLFLAALCAALLGCATSSTDADWTYEPRVGQTGKDVIWVPTKQLLVDAMLDMAEITPRDYLVDLGSGDGRTVITAAKRGTRAHGIEFNPDLVELSKRAARAEGVSRRATFEQGDIFEADFSDATVVTLYLLPDLNLKLRPTLLAMKPGTRIVSNSFEMGDWEEDEMVHIKEGCPGYCMAYKWVVPARVEGTWAMDDAELELRQRFQMLEGVLRRGGSAQPISDARLDGARIRFTVGAERYTGEVDGDRMRGVVDGSRAWRATRRPG